MKRNLGPTTVTKKNEEEYYLDQYKILHKHPHKFAGDQTPHHRKEIGELVRSTGAQTLLDFGCGKGWQYKSAKIHEDWGVEMPTLYDPAVPQYKALPDGPFDGVICTDVLEHVPESAIQKTMTDILTRSTKFAFLTISIVPALTILPNGLNAHCTVKHPKWWNAQISQIWQKIPVGVKIAMVFKQGRNVVATYNHNKNR